MLDPEKALEAVKEAAAIIPKVYEDAAQPAMRELGKTLGGAVRVGLSPANFVVWTYDQVLEMVQPRIAERLAKLKVAPDEVRQPSPEIAGPTLSALRFPNQDPSLRELYLNLLARAMDAREAAPHPAFADVLRQLSPSEARLVPALVSPRPDPPPAFPAIAVNVLIADGSGFITPLPTACAFGMEVGDSPLTPQEWIENLSRLGLIEVDRTAHLHTADVYERLERHPQVESIKQQAQSQGLTLRIDPHMVQVTTFGLAFARACTIGDPEPVAESEARSP